MEAFKNRICKTCGDKLKGRSDKIFCDDRCRNQFHNEQRKTPPLGEYARSIQRSLLRNRRILHDLLSGRNRCYVNRDTLLRLGFSFEYISERQIKRRGEIFSCLDIGYLQHADGRILVMRHNRGVGIFM
jgi:hypothetical protein